MCSSAKKAIQSYFQQNTNSGNVNNKSFWNTIRPFINNKGTHDNHDIILEENGDLVKDKGKVSEILNNFYINIVEKTTGKQPLVLNSTSSQSVDDEIDHINGKYENHESIKKIKEHVSLRVWEICESCELLVAASCESLRVTFPSLLLPSFYSYLLITASFGIPGPSHAPRLGTFFIVMAHLQWLSVGCLYLLDRGSMDQGRVDHGSQSFGGNGNSGASGNVTNGE